MNPMLLASGTRESLPLIAGVLCAIFFIAAIVRTIHSKHARDTAARAQGRPPEGSPVGIHDPYQGKTPDVPPAPEPAPAPAPQAATVFSTEASSGTTLSSKPTPAYVWE